MNKISEVIELALFIHNDQLDKAGVDYILHPLHIMQQVKDYGEGHMVVAILHDALEGFEGEDYEENEFKRLVREELTMRQYSEETINEWLNNI